MVVISVYTYGVKIIKKFRWESCFLWGGSMEPPLCTNGSARYLMQLSVKDLRGNPKPRVSPDPTGPDRNRSGVREHFKEYFRVGSGRGILFRVGPGRGIFYRGMRHFPVISGITWILHYKRRWYVFLFTDSHDVLFDKRMIWFSRLYC